MSYVWMCFSQFRPELTRQSVLKGISVQIILNTGAEVVFAERCLQHPKNGCALQLIQKTIKTSIDKKNVEYLSISDGIEDRRDVIRVLY